MNSLYSNWICARSFVEFHYYGVLRSFRHDLVLRVFWASYSRLMILILKRIVSKERSGPSFSIPRELVDVDVELMQRELKDGNLSSVSVSKQHQMKEKECTVKEWIEDSRHWSNPSSVDRMTRDVRWNCPWLDKVDCLRCWLMMMMLLFGIQKWTPSRFWV